MEYDSHRRTEELRGTLRTCEMFCSAMTSIGQSATHFLVLRSDCNPQEVNLLCGLRLEYSSFQLNSSVSYANAFLDTTPQSCSLLRDRVLPKSDIIINMTVKDLLIKLLKYFPLSDFFHFRFKRGSSNNHSSLPSQLSEASGLGVSFRACFRILSAT